MDRYTATLDVVSEVVDTLRRLEIPDGRVHGIDVGHWSNGTQASRIAQRLSYLF